MHNGATQEPDQIKVNKRRVERRTTVNHAEAELLELHNMHRGTEEKEAGQSSSVVGATNRYRFGEHLLSIDLRRHTRLNAILLGTEES